MADGTGWRIVVEPLGDPLDGADFCGCAAIVPLAIRGNKVVAQGPGMKRIAC
jgi:hypothetical protein